MGKKYFAQLIRISKESGLLSKTAAFSNLGKVDRHNEHGTKAQICESISTTTSHGLFLAMSSINNTFRLSITYQLAEFNREEIIEFVKAYELTIMELIGSKSFSHAHTPL